MRTLTVAELMNVVRRCAGESEHVTPSAGRTDEQLQDEPFTDLGYDSLALLETAGVLERDYGLEIDDDAMVKARSPRELTEVVNAALVRAD